MLKLLVLFSVSHAFTKPVTILENWSYLDKLTLIFDYSSAALHSNISLVLIHFHWCEKKYSVVCK